MKPRAFILAALCLLFSRGVAVAGWYQVTNFAGSIGPYPVHVSLQTYDNFGSGITVEGSYYYDSKDSPIALYGTVVNGTVRLCDIPDAKTFDRIIVKGSKTPVDTTGCSFALTVDNNGASGTWSNAAKTYPVALKKVASLDDTDEGKINGTPEIPFWSQTAADMFLGVYGKFDDSICMSKLQVVDKASKKPVQEIPFDTGDCTAGTVMTPIYMNVSESGNALTIEFNEGKMGSEKVYVFDKAKKAYVLKK